MPEVYYYVSSEKVPDIIDCGLKLSACYDKVVNVEDEPKQCFAGLLNPRDDLYSYKSDILTCIKVQVKGEQCFVADRFIYETIKEKPGNWELYNKSIVPLEKYIFGAYRYPECLITSTILAGEAAVLDSRMDSPIIYENSEDLYINNILNYFREHYEKFDDYLLYSFFNRLAELNKLDKIESKDGKKAVFTNESGGIYCIRKQEANKFL
ncbi:MAG TPA: hypothetical protein VHP38_06530 [Ruminiclostridium sp.]|nr:hypothetical protein [Ruminiclostridium sp.]